MRRARQFAAALAVALMTTKAAVAAEDAAAHAAGSEPLPQFMPEFFAGQLFWLALSFGALYLLLRHLALPRVDAVQTARAAAKAADLAAAARAQEQAQTTIQSYEKTLADARHQAQDRLRAILDQARAEAARQQAAQNLVLSQRLGEAEQRIASERHHAMSQVRDAAIDVAQSMLARLGVPTAVGAVAAAVDRAQTASGRDAAA